jgi:DNA-binding response OmpR family regulator
MNAQEADPARDLPTVAGRRLVVVDAAGAWRDSVAEFFTARGWHVSALSDGVSALSHILAFGTDVVVMNASLPGLRGVETAVILSRVAPGVRIVLTVPPDEDPGPRAHRATTRVHCLTKSLDFDALARAVNAPAPRGDDEEDP